MRRSTALALILASIAITFVVTVYFYAPDYCRLNGNMFDCDDYYESWAVD